MSAVTVAPALLHTLANTQEDEAEAWRDSMFSKDPEKVDGRTRYAGPQSFLNNERAYREAFATRYAGKGETKMKQVSSDTVSLALRRCPALADVF